MRFILLSILPEAVYIIKSRSWSSFLFHFDCVFVKFNLSFKAKSTFKNDNIVVEYCWSIVEVDEILLSLNYY